MHAMNRPSLALAALALTLPAQDKPPQKTPATPDVKSFLPDDYRNVAVIDFAALNERGVWEELDVPPLSVMLRAIEKESGFKLSDLDRMTMVMCPRSDANERTVDRLVVIEAHRPLALAPSVLQNWSTETIGGHEVRRRTNEWMDDVVYQPRPEVTISGPASLLEPALTGKPRSGQPCPDVMSLLSARANRLAWMVVDVANGLAKRDVLDTLLPHAAWPEDDAPAFVCLQLLATGDADDPHLVIEGILRHTKDGAGIAASGAAVKEAFERLGKEPKARLLWPTLKTAQVRADRGDLIVSVDLGRARVAAGQLALVFGASMLVPVEAAAVAPAQVVPQPAPAPAPAPKKQ